MPHNQGSPEGRLLGWILIVFGGLGSLVHPLFIFVLVIGLFTLGCSQRPSD